MVADVCVSIAYNRKNEKWMCDCVTHRNHIDLCVAAPSCRGMHDRSTAYPGQLRAESTPSSVNSAQEGRAGSMNGEVALSKKTRQGICCAMS